MSIGWFALKTFATLFADHKIKRSNAIPGAEVKNTWGEIAVKMLNGTSVQYRITESTAEETTLEIIDPDSKNFGVFINNVHGWMLFSSGYSDPRFGMLRSELLELCNIASYKGGLAGKFFINASSMVVHTDFWPLPGEPDGEFIRQTLIDFKTKDTHFQRAVIGVVNRNSSALNDYLEAIKKAS